MLSLFIVLISCVSLSFAAEATTPYECPGCVQTRLGRAEYVYGPAGEPLDSPFFSIGTEYNLLGYSANGDTTIIAKGTINATIPHDPPIALMKGPKGSFDECGSWMDSAIYDNSLVRAWYHAESNCNYNEGETYKSIAYAESTSGGVEFDKPGYPQNQVLTGTLPPTPHRTTGNGDHTVIDWSDGYYYMFFVNWDYYSYSVAKAPISSGGVPGSWVKYYNGKFSEPGLGGNSSRVPQLVGTYVRKHESGNLMCTDSEDGIIMGFGADPITWHAFDEPLIYSESNQWVRDSKSTELYAYPSLVPFGGGATPLSNTLWLYYTYLFPGQDFDKRYLVRRQMTINIGKSSFSPKAGVELSRYTNATFNSWSTTAFTSDFSYDTSLGFILTKEFDGTSTLYDCYMHSSQNYYLSIHNCSLSNGLQLRKLGWIFSTEQRNTQPLFNCLDITTYRNFASVVDCEDRGKVASFLGWIYIS